MSNNPFANPNNNVTGAPSGGVTPMPGQSASNPNDAFEIDLSEVQESSYAIPDGAYRAKCIDIAQDVSKSGNPMFVWDFEITAGEFAGRTFKSWTAVTPAAMWKVAETVIALGVGQTGEVVKFKRGDVLGKECGIVMEQDEYNGKTTSRISKVISLAELAQELQNAN